MDENALRICKDVQHMIDINSDHLETLRNCVPTTSELTKQEIRTLEGKLIKLFSKQLAIKASQSSSSSFGVYPNLNQWLIVVGIALESREIVESNVSSLEALKDKTDYEILKMLSRTKISSGQKNEDFRRLSKALRNLKKYTEALVEENRTDLNQLELYWDSWDHDHEYSSSSSISSSHHQNKQADSAASSFSSTSGSIPPPSPIDHHSLVHSPPLIPKINTPPITPPWTSVFVSSSNNKSINKSIPLTPPPSKKNSVVTSPPKYGVDTYALCKSQSNEFDFVGTNRFDESSLSTTRSHRSRLATEPAVITTTTTDEGIEPDPSPLASPRSPNFALNCGDHGEFSTNLQVPKSPRTPRSMGHLIRHRFKKTLKPAKCALCHEYMFSGLKCKECKYKCHKDCESNVPPSCGLPDPLINYYMSHLSKEGSPILGRHVTAPTISAPKPEYRSNACDPDSSSNTSSCNSSAPNSPAVIFTNTGTSHSASSTTIGGPHFRFPDPPFHKQVHLTEVSHYPAVTSIQKVSSPNPLIDTVKSYDSDKTLSGTSGSSGSVGTTYRLDSQDSTASVDENSSNWVSGRQLSISTKEWDIAYDEVKINDKIGSGRFSTVHQGNWHGDVAIKILTMENLDDEVTLEAFRLDVATFRKTRHENLILFMGACMNPPKLAIVTSLCKGNTLYTHLHLRKDRFPMNRVVQIAQQIAQGMGYLHHRGIIHKDLKTKNIFIENGRAVITDFGLVNVAGRLCARLKMPGISHLDRQEYMSIPEGWLCYLAPEIMRSLRVQPVEADLPFNKASDIYAFGTVWFELLTMEWPWKMQPPETIIWMVGRGMKPSLANLQASKDVKDILTICWTYKITERPDFTDISNNLNLIPKKRSLIRSPSHPLQLSRSAESVF